ncbi:MAG: thiamine phosphate synthase [Verrucomicrobiota bacterium]|jgi:thiamine-phosphate pyrophosphorylase
MRCPTGGFYGILDADYVSERDWNAKGRALLEGGASLLQIRAKRRPTTAVLALAQSILPLAQTHGVPLIINDHLEVALQLPDAGLHVGQEDLCPESARRQLGPDRLLGLSTHSSEQVQQALQQAHLLSYFAVGPIFPTGTKPDYVPVGLNLLRHTVALSPPIPVFAIGGITRLTLGHVLETGVRGVVAVSDPLLDPHTAKATAQFVKRINRSYA